MLGLALVAPLEQDWRSTLDAVARSHGWPASDDVADLAGCVSTLSVAYNDPARARASMHASGAARLGFGFVRDVPKGAAAVRELVATGALRLQGTLRILDLGSGLGAMTWGVARALEASGASGVIEATWVDTDALALDAGVAIVRQRAGRGRVEVRARSVVASVAHLRGLGTFDLVLCGHLLSELDVGADEEARAERHASMLGVLLDAMVAPSGSLVVIEPALRDRTRHLHRVRDLLVRRGTTVFAPCLHASGCPALVRETDWCHEDLPIDLPPWLVPVARRAGLRREGLTFSYLVLRRDTMKLADCLPHRPAASSLRAVSDRFETKGKDELFLCGEFAHRDQRIAARAKVMRLDRDARSGNKAWDDLRRGAVVIVDPAPESEQPRIGASTSVSIASDGLESR
jgi:ribosomal protein RSM22 (predicted rRNA methylase)